MIEIAEMKQKLLTAEIVENLGDESLIDIGDIVKIDMIFSESDREEEIFKLVATNPSFGLDTGISEVSINSPIGKAMYHKRIGETAQYKVNDRTFTIQIKEKVLLDLEEKTLTKKR